MGDAIAENAAWSYEAPMAPVAGLGMLIAFYGNRVDAIVADEPATP